MSCRPSRRPGVNACSLPFPRQTIPSISLSDLEYQPIVVLEVEDLRSLDLTVSRDLLQHSFYRRWVTGDLSLSELRDYSCQYARVVARLPVWLRMTAASFPEHRLNLEEHADEEQAHILLWTEFALGLGVSARELASKQPNEATVRLLELGDQLSAAPIGAALVWALEIQTPAVSIEKLRGLQAHYGIDANNGGRYFEIHSSRDLVHAAELEVAIADLPPNQLAQAQRAAEQATDRLWDLLTAVELAA